MTGYPAPRGGCLYLLRRFARANWTYCKRKGTRNDPVTGWLMCTQHARMMAGEI